MSAISLSPAVVFRLLKKTFANWMEDNAMRLSASLAFYSIFSLAPLLLITVSVVGWVFGEQARQGMLQQQMQQYVGPTAAESMQAMVQSADQPTGGFFATLIGIVTLLFGATVVFIELKAAMNTIWEVKAKSLGIRGMVRARLLSFGMVLAIGFLLLVSLTMTTLLNGFSGWIENALPLPAFVWGIFAFVLAFAVETLLFAVIFKVLPDVKIEWRQVWIGAAVTALLFEIGKWGLSVYLGTASPGSSYGAAGSFVALLVWIYYASAIVFFGAEFTQVYAEETGNRIEPSKLAEPMNDTDRSEQGLGASKREGAPAATAEPVPEPLRESVAYLAAPPRGYRRRRDSDLPRKLSDVPEYLDKNPVVGLVAAIAGGFLVGIVSRRLDRREEETPVEKISSGTKALAVAVIPLATGIGRRLAAQAAKTMSSRALHKAGKWLQKRFSIIAILALCTASFSAANAEEKSKGKENAPSPEQIEAATRLQIYLDQANFGPGKIDGRVGEFTRKALTRYREAKGMPPPKPEAPREDQLLEVDVLDLDLKSIEPVFTRYTVTKEDVEGVGNVPETPEEQAKLKLLAYRSVAEGVAEKFHCDLKFFKELNPDVNTDSLKEGDEVKVPNVEPFELAAVESIEPGSAFASAEEQPAEAGKKESAKQDGEDLAAEVKIHISSGENMLELREGDQLIAAFPITSGSAATASPIGQWKVTGVAKRPDFRYDKKMLKEGERSSDFHVLPPGPNNPVGVVWIALNKKGIGIHGTDSPDTIGRAASHGCIRMANWDVVKLARMVKAGVPVTIE